MFAFHISLSFQLCFSRNEKETHKSKDEIKKKAEIKEEMLKDAKEIPKQKSKETCEHTKGGGHSRPP